MMAHLDEGEVQALLDGELPESEAAGARRHLESCEGCAAEYERAREAAGMVTAAISLLDLEMPRARQRLIPPSTVGRRPWRRMAVARAAALLLVFAAAASATLPGSPVRSWITGMLEPDLAPLALEEEAATTATPTIATRDAPTQPGISVEPLNGRLRILLTRPARDLQVRVQLTDSRVGWVDGATRFESRVGMIEVIEPSGEEIRVEIPREVTSASLEIDGRTYVTKEGERLNLVGPVDEGEAAEVVFRVRR